MTPTLSDAFKRLGETLVRSVVAVADFYVAAVEVAGAILTSNWDKALALVAASPRVRHLALHGKKYRTRKKNINRALREYNRRRSKK